MKPSQSPPDSTEGILPTIFRPEVVTFAERSGEDTGNTGLVRSLERKANTRRDPDEEV